MIVAAMIAYYVVACGLIALVGYLAYRRNVRDLEATYQQAMAELQALADSDKPSPAPPKRMKNPRVLPPPARAGKFPPPTEVVELRSQGALASESVPPNNRKEFRQVLTDELQFSGQVQVHVERRSELLPTEKEIAELLPRWAWVAFAARCARRVLPLFKHFWSDAPQNRLQALREAVTFAERSATQATAEHDFSFAEAAGSASIEVAESVQDGAAAHSADRTAVTAYDAAACAAYAGAARVEVRNGGVKIVPAAAMNATAAGRAVADIQQTVRRDFDHLAWFAGEMFLTDNASVPPSVFGPLWPDGPPSGWPELPNADTLSLTIPVPDGIPLDDAVAWVKELIVAISALHQAGGGYGWKVIPPVSITVPVRALVPNRGPES